MPHAHLGMVSVYGNQFLDDSLVTTIAITSNEDLTFELMPYGTMLQIISAIVASLPIAIASQTVFSVHDDLLAFPQVIPRRRSFCAKLTTTPV